MSDRRVRSVLLPLALLLGSGMTLADDEDAPDMDFLEYLGMWEGADDEWLVFDSDGGLRGTDSAEPADPAPRAEDPAEKDDVE